MYDFYFLVMGLRICIVQSSSFLLSFRTHVSLGCFFFFLPNTQRELSFPFALSFFRNEVFARPLPWVPHVVMALSCCHSFALPGLFFKIFIQNVVILLLGAVLTHPWAFYGLFLFFILFLWTYPLELCSFHLWEGVGFICSCRLNFFRL